MAVFVHDNVTHACPVEKSLYRLVFDVLIHIDHQDNMLSLSSPDVDVVFEVVQDATSGVEMMEVAKVEELALLGKN